MPYPKLTREVHPRIIPGIEYLDAQYGLGWPDKIDIDKLDLEFRHQDIVGQIFEQGYEEFKYLYDLSQEDCEDLAFERREGETYASLNKMWKKAIKQLQSK
jgi:hypothetical protein